MSILVLAAGSSAGSVTGTIVAGTNNNWGTGGNVASPVAITGNITVPAGVTLTIQPGCVITGAFTVTVNGILIINGAVDKYVDWSAAKLVFASGSGPSILRFIKIISYTSPNVIFPNSIDVNGANVDFEHVEIQDLGTYGINVTGAASVVKINFCTIGAKSRTFSSTLGPATSVNIAADAAAANVTISNSILGLEENPQMIGLAVRGTATNTKISYTFITGPRVGVGSTETNLYLNVTPGVFDIPNMRFFLADLSPAVDAADPADNTYTNEPVPNGGRTDCGYYGGTAQATKSQLQVRKPAAGEPVVHGSYKISWWGGRFAGTKKVDYSTDNGANWTTVGTAAIGDTSIMWTVPAVKTLSGRVRVAYTSVNNVIDTSDAFAIDTVPPAGQVCDPNKVLKNPKYFACIPYAGYRQGQAPGGAEPSYAQVQQDLSILAPYTHGIRTYGTSWRNNPAIGHDYIPHFCDSLNLNLYMGIWLDNPYGDATNLANCDQAITVVNQGHKCIKSIIVGNEYLLRVEQAHGDLVAAEANLIKYINYVRGKLPAGSSIKITTGESYPDWLLGTDALIKAVDIVYWHVHPWWEGKAINVAAEWAATAHQKMKDRLAKAGVNKPMVLAETGYPWGATQGAAVGSEANQAQYLKDLHAYAFKVGLEYFFFEGFDEPWKASMEGGVGDKWGMWNKDRQPHQIIQNIATLIPACMKWEDPETASTGVSMEPKPTGMLVPVSVVYDKINVYTLQGRLVAKLTSGRKGFANVKQYLGMKKPASSGVLIIDYMHGKTTAKTEKFAAK